jgi:hypothetical protein
MPAFAWAALLFLAVAITGSSVFLAVRALAAWRTFGSVSGSAGDAVDGVLASAAAAEAHAVSLGEGSERLAAATARLQESLARLATIRAAFEETQRLVRRLRGAVPLK